jgi:hypothetical protein
MKVKQESLNKLFDIMNDSTCNHDCINCKNNGNCFHQDILSIYNKIDVNNNYYLHIQGD